MRHGQWQYVALIKIWKTTHLDIGLKTNLYFDVLLSQSKGCVAIFVDRTRGGHNKERGKSCF